MKRKNKNVWLITAVFGSIAIASTGFAAWIITGGDQKSVGTNVVVETADDQRLKLNVAFLDDQGGSIASLEEEDQKKYMQYVLGDTSSTTGFGEHGHWLEDTTKEDLTVKLEVTCENYVPGTSEVVWTIGLYEGKDLVDCSQYISFPAGEEITMQQVGETSTYKGTIDVTIGWGTLFGKTESQEGKNPGIYFSNYDPSEDNINGEDSFVDNGAYAEATMNNMYNFFNGKKFTIKITANTEKSN